MKKYTLSLFAAACALCAALCCAVPASAEIRHEMLKDIAFQDAPKDITFSRDGSTAYILGQKSIMVYSVPDGKVTDTIPLARSYARMALSPDESQIFLAAPETQQVSVVQITVISNIEAGNSPVIGNLKAPVTVTAFFDFQCPYCAKVYPTLKELLAKYPKDVRLVIKHYPLPMHQFAEKSAMASLAASRQNKYDAVADLFFTNFTKLNDQTIRQYVQEAGVNMEQFEKDLQSADLKNILAQDQTAVRQAKVRAVPAIFINGIAPKARSLEAFSQLVEEELKKKK